MQRPAPPLMGQNQNNMSISGINKTIWNDYLRKKIINIFVTFGQMLSTASWARCLMNIHVNSELKANCMKKGQDNGKDRQIIVKLIFFFINWIYWSGIFGIFDIIWEKNQYFFYHLGMG